jgi:precorrin-6x reductase
VSTLGRGAQTRAKLDAARARKLAVIVVRRSPRPRVDTVAGVEGATAWAQGCEAT